MPRRFPYLGVAATVLVMPAALAAEPASAVADTSFVAASGERVLQQSIDIEAPSAKIWDAFVTTEGFRSWAAPVAHVDFRLGGILEAAQGPQGKIGAAGNIKNQVVAYIPQRMLAIRNVQAPLKTPFDQAVFQAIHTVIFLEPLASGRTRVTMTQPGYRAGAAYDGVYTFFAAGNGWSLEQLKKVLEAK